MIPLKQMVVGYTWILDSLQSSNLVPEIIDFSGNLVSFMIFASLSTTFLRNKAT